jgi:hypothetical protein
MKRLAHTLRRALRGASLATALALVGALLPAPPAQAQAGWGDWFNLVGGASTGRPAVGMNLDGRLEVFVRGGDGALWHIWHGGPNHGWSNWESLGGSLTSNPVVARNEDGRLEVFVLGPNRRLYHIWQVAPNSRWSGWEWLMAGPFDGDPAVARNEDGRLEVFVRGTRQLYHIWQTRPNGNWSNGENLGGNLGSDPQVGQHLDGRLQLFARTSSVNGVGTLATTQQSRPNGEWTVWSSLGGAFVGNPAVGRNADGRLEVFVRGADNHLYHIWRRNVRPFWTDWQPLQGDLHPQFGDPKVALNRGGGLEVYVVGFDSSLWRRWQTRWSSSDDYMPWQSLGGADIADATIAVTADGRLEAFVRQRPGYLWHKWQQ